MTGLSEAAPPGPTGHSNRANAARLPMKNAMRTRLEWTAGLRLPALALVTALPLAAAVAQSDAQWVADCLKSYVAADAKCDQGEDACRYNRVYHHTYCLHHCYDEVVRETDRACIQRFPKRVLDSESYNRAMQERAKRR